MKTITTFSFLLQWRHLYGWLPIILLVSLFSLLQTVYFIFTPRAPQGCQRLPLWYTVGKLPTKKTHSAVIVAAQPINISCYDNQQLLSNRCFWVFRLSNATWWHHLQLLASLSLCRCVMSPPALRDARFLFRFVTCLLPVSFSQVISWELVSVWCMDSLW